MAELFSTGVNRVLYRSRGFAVGKVVTAYIWSPSLAKSSLLTFTSVGEGLYYLDYDFAAEGTYLGKFFEDGIPTVAGVFRVSDIVTILQGMQVAQGGGLTID
jgi:hypothetical protein